MELERIVVIHDSLDARGGATMLARLSAIEYRALGYKVTYITGAYDDGSLDEYGIETISLGQERLRGRSKFGALVGGLYNRATVETIANWIEANDTPNTVYHLHNWAQILSPSVFAVLEPVAARTIMSCHDVFNACPNGGLLHFPTSTPCELKPMSTACWMSQCDRRSGAHKYWRMLRQLNLNRLAKFHESEITFVCLHKGMEDLLRSIGFHPPRLTNLPNPALGYSDERITCEDNKPFLFIGRLTYEKGADIALEATEKAGVPIEIVGEGELEETLKGRHDHATFAGFSNRERISEIAKRSRAIIVPSRVREPFGLVVAEAALSGLPVLISKQSMLSAQIEQLGMGAVFEPNKPEDLAQKVKNWAEDSELIRRMSSNAIANADQICSSPRDWAKGFVKIMQDRVAEAFIP